MKKAGTSLYKRVLAIAMIVFLIGGIVSTLVKTDFGNVLVRDVDLTPRGTTLHGVMYIPKDALEIDENGEYINKHPAILLSHGYVNTNAYMDGFAIELSRRGFVVFSIDMTGHGESEVSIGKEEPQGETMGAIDAYNYLSELPYVDQTRVGFAGHSMGGKNTGNAIAVETGFYTLADRLLNMLHDELGVEITEEDVTAQDPDAIAATLDESKKAVYDLRRTEIEDEFNTRPKAELFIGSGTGFAPMADSQVVEVAGHKVWRDLQANVGVAITKYEENAPLMFSSEDDGILDASRILETTQAKRLFGRIGDTIKERTWYSVNLSSDENQLLSTELIGMDEHDLENEALNEAVANGTARLFTQPSGEHAFQTFGNESISFAVDFFTEVFQYNNGEISEGAVPSYGTNTIWFVKELANGAMLVSIMAAIYCLAMCLLETSFFATLKGEVKEATLSKKDKAYWICTIVTILAGPATYLFCFNHGGAPTTYDGSLGLFAYSTFLSEEIPTRVGLWAFLNGVIAFAVFYIKYLIVDRKNGKTFRESLSISKDGWFKSLLLAVAVAAFGFILTAFAVMVFAGNYPRFLVVAFCNINNRQLIAWICYSLIFFIYYYANSVAVNTSRMKDMSETSNLVLNIVTTCIGITLYLAFIFGYLFTQGHLRWLESGLNIFMAAGVIVAMPLLLMIAAFVNRKFYMKTGKYWVGAFMNTLILTWIFVGNNAMHYTMFVK